MESPGPLKARGRHKVQNKEGESLHRDGSCHENSSLPDISSLIRCTRSRNDMQDNPLGCGKKILELLFLIFLNTEMKPGSTNT